MAGVDEQGARIRAIVEPLILLVGNRALLLPPAGAGTESFLQAFLAVGSAGSEGGSVITPGELDRLIGARRPANTSADDVRRSAERWNRTQDYYPRGIRTVAQVPAGSSTDFIDRDLLARLLGEARAAIVANEVAGFLEPMAGVISALDRLKAEIQKGSGGDSICARVRLRLEQDVVQARQGFRASLDLVNNSDAVLEGVKVELTLVDELGNPSDSRFGVLPPEVSNIGAVDGTGRVNSSATGSARWMLIPGPDAAPTEAPVRYFVGGIIEYRQGDVTVRMPIARVPITVLPIPQLVLQYFHERDVRSDDPFTVPVEPSIPYSLAVLVNNRGAGTARDLRITSSEPKIIENEKGLLIDFDLIATEVAGQNLLPSLTAAFGDVPPGGTRVGRWLFQSTLQGQFIEYSAAFEHTGPFSGRPELASVRDVSIHEMIHLVQADRGFADGKPDFLVNDVADDDFLPDTLYLSDGSTNRVQVVRVAQSDGPATPSDREVRLSFDAPVGWTYLRIPDPANGAMAVARVLRPDGSEVPFGWNVWTTDRTFIAGGRRPTYENNLHLFDLLPGGPVTYTVVYAPPVPPDTTDPVSDVLPLPAQSRAQFSVRWDGSDSGSGVRYFDVLVSTDGGPFVTWKSSTRETSALYTGEMGRSYAFYTVAVDEAGNRESVPTGPDAATRVSLVNQAPVFQGSTAVNVPEGSVLAFQCLAVDPDNPSDTVTHRLGSGAPAGMQIDSRTGRVTWPTGEGSGPSRWEIEVVAVDDGLPPMSATHRVTVTVAEDNEVPQLGVLGDRVVAETVLLEVAIPATDVDLPVQSLRYRFVTNPPLGAALDPVTGIFRWRPDPTQGPSTNRIRVAVSDGELEAQGEFVVVVRDTQADFRLKLGEATILAGESGAVDVTVESQLELASIQTRIRLSEVGLTQLSIRDLAPVVGSATLEPVSAGEYALVLAAGAGQSLRMQGVAARLGFGSDPFAESAFVRLQPVGTEGSLGGVALGRVGQVAGRVVVVGSEPLLEAMADRTARLYGRPGVRYAIDSSAALEESGVWLPWREELMQSTLRLLPEVRVGDLFLRARELP